MLNNFFFNFNEVKLEKSYTLCVLVCTYRNVFQKEIPRKIAFLRMTCVVWHKSRWLLRVVRTLSLGVRRVSVRLKRTVKTVSTVRRGQHSTRAAVKNRAFTVVPHEIHHAAGLPRHRIACIILFRRIVGGGGSDPKAPRHEVNSFGPPQTGRFFKPST